MCSQRPCWSRTKKLFPYDFWPFCVVWLRGNTLLTSRTCGDLAFYLAKHFSFSHRLQTFRCVGNLYTRQSTPVESGGQKNVPIGQATGSPGLIFLSLIMLCKPCNPLMILLIYIAIAIQHWEMSMQWGNIWILSFNE